MTYSNRGGSSFGGGNYGRRDTNDRSSGTREMFDATCAQCGSACKVPFRPNGRKEVFCSKCFEQNGGGSRESFGGNRESSFGASRGPRMYDKRDSNSSFGGGDRQMFGATCDQCGERCEVPFRPTNGKPVLCSNCFAGKSEDRSFSTPRFSEKAPKDNSRELEVINAKLDKILKLLSPSEPMTVKDVVNEEAKAVAKDITAKILEEIEMTSGKKVVKTKKKSVSKKKAE